MREMYQTPDVKVVKFDVEGKIMDDFTGGEFTEIPSDWLDEISSEDTPVPGV